MTKARDLANGASALSAVSATELGYLDGVTSAVQTQIDGKQAVNANVSTTELGYLDGVTSAVQTQLDAKIPKTLTTTTGDIIYASAANTPARLGIGSTNQVLKVTAGVPAWATPAASGLNYVTGATFSSVSSFDLPTNTFSTTYRNYQIYLDFSSGTGGGELQIRVRKDGTTTSSSIYEYGNVNINRGGSVTGNGGNGDTAWRLGYSNYWDRGANVITVYNPKGSGQKITVTGSVGTGDGVNGQAGGMWQGSISAIDSLNFSISTGTMSGTYRVYGLADA